MEDLQTKLDNLKAQQEQAKEVFVKCQGAIELVEAMLEEKVSAIDNMFGIYLKYKQEDERFQKFIHEKLEKNIDKGEDERAE